MISLNIGKGYLIITDESGQLFPGWLTDEPPIYPELPEPSDFYQKCVSRGYSPEHIIDLMLFVFHRQRFIRGGFLYDRDIVVGLVGGRGGGKSCSGAAIAIWDFLLCGFPVFSNMNIEVTVRYKQASKVFRSTSLDRTSLLDTRTQDQMYRNCLIFVDEANIEMADAQRTMGNKALWFSYALQQARKRHICFIHTEQSEYHVTDRVRFQTNLYISCRDAAYQHGTPKPDELGRKSQWKVHDYSGILTGHSYDGDPVMEPIFHMTPFWHSYDTEQIQTGEVDLPDFKKKKSDIEISESEGLAAKKEKYVEGASIVSYYSRKGRSVDVWTDSLWDLLGIAPGDRARKTSIGMQLGAFGVTSHKGTGNRRFYRFPPLSEFDNNGV
jgi:hypothetical protein